MLSASSAAVVRETLPVVGAAIGDITPVFYGKMFADHPELLDNLFNRGNQVNGEQQKALAGSIATFATLLLERPDDRPDAMLARIAHKHVSVGVTEDQYPLVHHYLFAAIVEVLGDIVTPEVAAAWDEVYWLMAKSLIAAEKTLMAQAGSDRYGQWRPWRVDARTEETADVVSFLLSPADDAPVPGFRPGQYVSVAVDLPDGSRQLRQYSLSSGPLAEQRRLTVKRVHGGGRPAGEVSDHLHRHTREGDLLQLSAPFGDIALEDGDGPLLLASAGIGITPMIGMLRHLSDTGSRRRVVVVHADRSEDDHAMRAEQAALVDALPGAELHLWYEQGARDGEARTGLCDLSVLDLPAGTTAYLCGPVPFLKATREDLLRGGVAARDVHYEVFGPDLGLA
ncbi:globin domain-containing protein [Streptomyces sp. NPDC059506]|uniref:globin domain-containing protein n=1 Tax=Streptomyces TaxID=1883 RepID=UPI000CAAF981|nr:MULTISPECIES: globin domain-containing protein [unclassified Streptomyces]MCZ2524791.1 FAD-binding oxidoreductase [Streptomyces sp. HB2AG]PLW69064.1 hemin transporter [Streptomyces sp. DJ]QMV21141.1 hemin transporter [Streptomyces sp. SCUT-3]